jgi:hypothetical protein
MLSDAVAILPVFKPFKPFLFFSHIIYHLQRKNRLEAIFGKNKEKNGDTATAPQAVLMRILSRRPCFVFKYYTTSQH